MSGSCKTQTGFEIIEFEPRSEFRNSLSRLFLLISFLAFSLYGRSETLPWYWDGTHGSELNLVRPFLPENPVILEAGAHCGEDTPIFLERWPEATVYAFEPNPADYTLLTARVSHLSNVYTFPYGLYTETGNYTLHVSRIWKGASSLFEDSHVPGNDYDDLQITIFCKNLDEWCSEKNIDRLDYLWLDMEGAELAMLKASPKILKTIKAISTEVNFREFRKNMPHFNEVKAFMEQSGFTLYKIWETPPDTHDWQATAVFIRSDLLL